MTDPSDPKPPKSRAKSARMPATIDLTPTVIENGRPEEAAQSVEGNPLTEASIQDDPALAQVPRSEGEGEMASSLEAGAGMDTLAQDVGPRQASSSRERFGHWVGAGLIGGLLGAGIVLGVQSLVPFAADDVRIADLNHRLLAAQVDTAGPIGRRLRILEKTTSLQGERIKALDVAVKQAAVAPTQANADHSAPSDPTALSDLSTRLTALEAEMHNTLQTSAATNQALEQHVNGQDQALVQQEQRLSDLSHHVADGRSSSMQAGIILILTERLEDALRQGQPYAGSLEALRRMQADSASLVPLEPFAQKGAPTASQLLDSFKPLGDAAVRDSRPAAQGWRDRLMRMLDHVVTIRSLDTPDAPGIPSIVARIEDRLAHDDIGAAVAAWEELPEPARLPSEDWARQARQRSLADSAAQALATQALASLNRTEP